MRFRTSALGPVLLSLLAASCGKIGRPSPPEFPGPPPARGITVRQLGPEARVGFETAGARGEDPGQLLARAELVRVAYGAGADMALDPDAFRRRGELVDEIPIDPAASGRRMYLTDPSLPEREHQTVRYAVRIRDRRGRASLLATAPDLVVLPTGAPPRDLHAEPTAQGIRLSWSPPEEAGELQYNIYRKVPDEDWPEEPLYPEPLGTTELIDQTAEAGRRYAYSARVVLAPGLPHRESAGSQPSEVLAEDRFAPAPPSGVVAVQEGAAVRLFWNPGRDRDLVGYRVYRSVDGSPFAPVEPDPVREPLFLDVDTRAGSHLAYRVTALDGASPPNESEPSSPVEIEIAAEPGEAGEPGG